MNTRNVAVPKYFSVCLKTMKGKKINLKIPFANKAVQISFHPANWLELTVNPLSETNSSLTKFWRILNKAKFLYTL